jgi:hypothetical protein
MDILISAHLTSVAPRQGELRTPGLAADCLP